MDRYGNPAPPPSWAAVAGFLVFVLLALAVTSDIWLSAWDHSQQWLDAPARIDRALPR